MQFRLIATLAILSVAAPACAKDPEVPAEQLPADRIDQVLALQPGVVARGDHPDESVTYIDGVPVQNGNRGNAFNAAGGPAVKVATNGFEEASITTGASAAEFGNAVSGVISIETRPRGQLRDTATIPTLLIRTGMISLRVDSLEPAIARLQDFVKQLGGYVGNTSFQGGEERRRVATLQLRIPASRFDQLQGGISAIGTVLASNVQVSDVGMEFTDAQARLKSKRQVEQRMLQLLATRTGKLSDVVELEESLEEVRSEIEQTEGQLRYMRNQISLSTVTVTLLEPGFAVQEPGYHPIRDSFGRAWNNFLRLVADLVAATGWLVPLLAMLWGGWRILARRRLRKAEE
jgi:hypothetical protein